MSATIRSIALGALLLFIAAGAISPNPFGNNPDVIADESYFLTSSLQAIQKHTLPGWEFSRSGNYYGGPQTYIDTAALIPVLGVVFIAHNFSRSETELWVALHTGELLHVLRTVNGVLWLAFICLGYWYCKRRKIPRELAWRLGLFVGLIASNVFFLQFLHTAKVWVLYTLITTAVGALFIASEFYRTHLGQDFLSRRTYAALLMWASALLFFQNYVGAFSTVLVALYAIALKHLSFRDFWEYFKSSWYWFAALTVTQLSFLWRAVFLNASSGSFNEISTLSPDHSHIVWLPRLLEPFRFALFGHPFVVLLFMAGVVWSVYMIRRGVPKRQKLVLYLACAYPVFSYVFFHVVVGFSSAPRYGILLTLALCLGAAILIGEFGKYAVRVCAVAAAILFVFLNIHAIALYWKPSTEVDLLRTINSAHSSSESVFIQEASALRLNLPINADSLELLDAKRASMSRFSYMLEHKDGVSRLVSFKPLTMLVYTDEEFSSARARFEGADKSVWAITTDCSAMCSASELESGRCFYVQPNRCGSGPQEVNLLPDFLSARQLGNTYFVHKLSGQ